MVNIFAGNPETVFPHASTISGNGIFTVVTVSQNIGHPGRVKLIFVLKVVSAQVNMGAPNDVGVPIHGCVIVYGGTPYLTNGFMSKEQTSEQSVDGVTVHCAPLASTVCPST